MTGHIETERKYIIEKPDAEAMAKMPSYTSSEITQIYLDGEEGVTHRVRRRVYSDRTVYTETLKRRISRASAVEEEREIAEAEYAALAARMKAGTSPVEKVRHTFLYCERLFEIDVYPSWKRTAIMENELEEEDDEVKMPPFIEIVREVTGIKGYSNAAMARRFPEEEATDK